MTWLRRLRSSIRSVVHRRDFEQQMNDELRFHIESYVEDLVRGGMPREQAVRQARIEFGALEAKKEDCRSSVGLRLWEELRSDVRYSVRLFRKSPGFAVVAITTLALGIGANTAIFSLIDAVMLRLLPVQKPQELYTLMVDEEPRHWINDTFTNTLWESLRDRQDVFSSMLAWNGPEEFDLAQGGAVQNVGGLFVSGGYFTTLGIAPAAGRLFSAADDQRGCAPLAVLSYGFWQSHFGGAPSAIGSSVSLRGHPFQIIGVVPSRFHGIAVGKDFDIAIPLCASAPFDARNLDSRGRWWLAVIGRLKPGIAFDQLKARLEVLSKPVMTDGMPPDNPAEQRHFLATKLVAVPVSQGPSHLRENFGRPLTILMLMVALVLLIACANITSLMLAKNTMRAKEIAIRKALGATRPRIVRQLVTESVLLSLLGAGIGVFFARWGSAVIVRNLSTGRDPVFVDVSLNARVLAFTAAAAVLTGIVMGVLPAMRSSGIALIEAMKANDAAGGGLPSRFKLGRWIVAGQVALSLVLLIGGGLLVRTFVKLLQTDFGFDPHHVLVVSAKRPWWAGDDAKIPAEQRTVVYNEIAERLRQLPGVTSVSRSFTEPMGDDNWGDGIQPDTASHTLPDQIWFNFVTPEYFATMRTPVFAGRNFSNDDTRASPPVAVISESLARRMFAGVNPIGRRLRRSDYHGPQAWLTIVGVVKDSKYLNVQEETQLIVFAPVAQAFEGVEADDFELRTAVAPETLISPALVTVEKVSPGLSLTFRTIAERVDDDLAQQRLMATLAGFFGGLALVLAMIGLYGVISYTVTQRKVEFGIRMALGAQPDSILRLVMRDVALVLAIGILAGLVVSLASVRILQQMLFGLAARDPITIVVSAALLTATALVAGYLPARRASRVNPLAALRYE